MIAPERPRVALSLGKFDGVHVGHRHLIAGLLDAASDGAEPAALVIFPNPQEVLAGQHRPLLTEPADRRARLRSLGVTRAEVLEFTPDLSQLGPDAFIDRLHAHFDLAAVVVGEGFTFGRDRAGDFDRLTRLADERGFRARRIPALTVDGARISSGLIRRLVESGEVEEARRLLRRAPIVAGTVVRGAARGRNLGFPTANLALRADYVVPRNGIYAVRVRWREGPWDPDGRAAGPVRRVAGVASVGVRPTFDNGERMVEVYLLDFAGDLYGSELTVEFVARQRDEERFETVNDLVAQMDRDCARAREILDDDARRGWVVDANRDGAFGTGPKRVAVTARGYDLAEALEQAGFALDAIRRNAADATDGVPRLGDPTQPAGQSAAQSHPVSDGPSDGPRPTGAASVQSDGSPAELARRWLAEAPQPARVYQAGAGSVRGLVPAGPERTDPFEIVDADVGASGHLTTLRLYVSMAERPDSDFVADRPGA